MLIDLQMHSNYSDGFYSPEDLAKLIAGRGIKIASLTDHNTIAGQEEFRSACKKLGIKSIPGIEFYCHLGHEKFNILWFNYQPDEELDKIIEDSQARRLGKVKKSLIILKNKGFEINEERILKGFNHYVPMNGLIARILANKNNRTLLEYPETEGDAIYRLFSRKGIAHLEDVHIDINRLLKIKKRVGGQIILNHPAKNRRVKEKFFEKLKLIGIDGVEVLSPHHSLGAISWIQFLARKYKFIQTGGTDFHNFEKENNKIHGAWDYFQIDSTKLDKIEKIIK